MSRAALSSCGWEGVDACDGPEWWGGWAWECADEPSPPRFMSVAASLNILLLRGAVQLPEDPLSEGMAEPFADPFSEAIFAMVEVWLICPLY